MMSDDELSPDARALLETARGGDDPSPADRTRVRRAVLAAVAGGAGVAASSAASSAAAAAGTTAVTTGGVSIGLKIVAALVVVGAVGGTVAVAPWSEPAPRPALSHHRRASAPVPVARQEQEEAPAPRAEPPAEVPEEPVVEPVIEPLVVTPRPHVLRAREPDPAPVAPVQEPPRNGLAEEVALLRRAQSALSSGDPNEALARLSEHARRFPNGSMAEERDAARILALCRAGRRDEARAAAQRFLRDRPSSPLAARVRASCD